MRTISFGASAVLVLGCALSKLTMQIGGLRIGCAHSIALPHFLQSPRRGPPPLPCMSATRCSTEVPTGAGRNPYRGVKRSKLQFERGRMRAFFVATSMAAIIGMLVATGAIAHESWFVRVCPTKTEANRVHLAFSGGQQGFSWSWIKGQTRDEIDLPRRFRSLPKLYIRGITVSMPGKIQAHAYVCIGFRDHIVDRMEFDDHAVRQKNWNDTDDCAC